jgi:hypothetical protein
VFRTDPLTDDGKIDIEFFSSHEYADERDCLVRYLWWEGFENKTEDFVIDFRSRRWQIILVKHKKND